jgi:hypothetical protein
MFCLVKIIRIVKYMSSLMSSLMSLIKLQKIPTTFLVIYSFSLSSCVAFILCRLVRSLPTRDIFLRRKLIDGPLILINRIQLVISMDSLFLKSLQIIFIAEKPLSASDVDLGIIINKLINGTKTLGVGTVSLCVLVWGIHWFFRVQPESFNPLSMGTLNFRTMFHR